MAAMFQAQSAVWEETQEKMSQYALSFITDALFPHEFIFISPAQLL